MKSNCLLTISIFVLLLSACQLIPPEEPLPAGELAVSSPDSGSSTKKTEILSSQSGPVETLTKEAEMFNKESMEAQDSVSFADMQNTDPEDLSQAPHPEVSWKTDPGSLIVSGTFCCGFTTPLVPLNYIPDVQIWGNGHIIWVERAEDGSRRVLEGWLSPQEMTQALQQVVDTGFFGMRSKYKNPLVADVAEKCLVVNLAGFEKQVCEYYEGAPQAFHELYDYLASGAGVEGEDYNPSSGYLLSFPLAVESMMSPDEVDMMWDSQSLGVSLSDAVDQGIWVDGDILVAAWETVNANPWGNIVQEGDRYYQISLQIPGLSWQEPPTR